MVHIGNKVATILIMDDLLWNDKIGEWVVRKKVRTEKRLVGDDLETLLHTVKYAEIPSFLHDSAFYKALSGDDITDDVVIPLQFFSAGDKVKNFPDLLHMFEVMIFWSVNTIPDSVIDFCHYCHHWDRSRIRNVLNNTIDEVGLLSDLKQIFCSDDPLTSAIRIGRTEVVTYLAKDRTNCYDPVNVAFAAYEGKLQYIQILRQHGYEWSSRACKRAALGGHLDCLQYLHENGCEWDCQVYACAASNNHWDCFKYAFENGFAWQFYVPIALIDCKNSDFLKYAIDNGCPLSTLAADAAAQSGSVSCLRLLLNAHCPVSSEACQIACRSNSLECLQLLHQHGALCDEKTSAEAAMRNGLSCLQYLHEQGSPWDEKTTEEAARYGCCSTLKYAIEHGCSYPDNIIETAAWNDSPMDCLKYLIEEQGLFMGNNGQVFNVAMLKCNPNVVQYLIDLGYDIHHCSDTESKNPLNKDLKYELKPSLDEPLLGCVKIALQYNWDLQRQAPALLRDVVRFSSEVPLLYAYLQAEGYVV